MSYHHLQGSLMWRRMQRVLSLPQVTYTSFTGKDNVLYCGCLPAKHLPDITQQNAVWILSAVWYFRSSACVCPFDMKRHLACSQISEVKALAVVIVFLCLSKPWHFLKFSYAPYMSPYISLTYKCVEAVRCKFVLFFLLLTITLIPWQQSVLLFTS